MNRSEQIRWTTDALLDRFVAMAMVKYDRDHVIDEASKEESGMSARQPQQRSSADVPAPTTNVTAALLQPAIRVENITGPPAPTLPEDYDNTTAGPSRSDAGDQYARQHGRLEGFDGEHDANDAVDEDRDDHAHVNVLRVARARSATNDTTTLLTNWVGRKTDQSWG